MFGEFGVHKAPNTPSLKPQTLNPKSPKPQIIKLQGWGFCKHLARGLRSKSFTEGSGSGPRLGVQASGFGIRVELGISMFRVAEFLVLGP